MGKKRNNINRRDFLWASAAGAGALYLSEESSAKPGSDSDAKAALLPRRVLGKTGQKLSILGLGGMVLAGQKQSDANNIVAMSIEKGVNYVDVSPEYGDSEIKLGPALEPFRKDVFLACKTARRYSEGAEKELHQSLKHLKTDYLDLYQFHNLDDPIDDVEVAFSKKGAVHAFVKAKEQGLIKHIGFSAHSTEVALGVMKQFDFDTIMFPINFCCHYTGKLSERVLAEANRRGMGILAIKSMIRERLPVLESTHEYYPKCEYEPIVDLPLAKDALSWTLSQKGVTAAIPPGDENLYKMALQLGPDLQPITDEGTKKLKHLAARLEPLFPM